MAVVFINTDEMDRFVRGLKDLIADAPPAASRMRSNLEYVGLSYPDLSRWGWNGSTIWRLNAILDDASRRLDFAIETLMTDKPWLSSWAGQTVWYDDAALISADAERIAALITQWENQANGSNPGEIPAELIDLLARNAGNPEFAAALAARLDPIQIAALVGLANSEHNYLTTVSPCLVSGFDEQYAIMLDLLGGTLSQATATMDPTQLEFFTQKWANFITDQPQGSPGAQLLSLVIGRGVWPDAFLTGIADAIQQCEDTWMGAGGHDLTPHQPVDWWGPGVMGPVIDPLTNPDGSHDVIIDPMGGVWRAAVNNPDWMITRYGSGLTEIVVDAGETHDQTMSVSQSVYDMFTARGLDAASAQWFVQALLVAGMTDPDSPGQFVSDVAGIAGYYTRQERIDESRTGWDKYKHIILPFAALVTAFTPVVGPYVSTGIMLTDAGFYYYEKDPVDGTISLVTALLPFAAARIAAHWSTTTFTAAELKALNEGKSVIIGGVQFRIDADLVVIQLEDGPDLASHVATVKRVNTRGGVIGGHNFQNFEQTFRDLNFDPQEAIQLEPGESFPGRQIYPGVYEVRYRVPRQSGPGQPPRDPVDLGTNIFLKTVYDPNMYTDADMLKLAKEAM